jgi:hypothetical protein
MEDFSRAIERVWKGILIETILYPVTIFSVFVFSGVSS